MDKQTKLLKWKIWCFFLFQNYARLIYGFFNELRWSLINMFYKNVQYARNFFKASQCTSFSYSIINLCILCKEAEHRELSTILALLIICQKHLHTSISWVFPVHIWEEKWNIVSCKLSLKCYESIQQMNCS